MKKNLTTFLIIFAGAVLVGLNLYAQVAPGVGAGGAQAGSVAAGGGGGGGSPGGSTGDFQTNAGGGNFGGVTPGTGVTNSFGNAVDTAGGFLTVNGTAAVSNKTYTNATLSGPWNYNGAITKTGTPISGNVVDLTKGQETQALTANVTWTFSGGHVAERWTGWKVSANGTPWTITLPASVNPLGSASALASFVVPASSTLAGAFYDDGTNYFIVNNPPVVTGTGSYVLENGGYALANLTGAGAGFLAAGANATNGTNGLATYVLGSSSAFGLVKVDGTSITASGGVISATTGGTGNVTNNGTLTATAIATGDGTTVVRTPSATSTLDTSGNIVLAGSITANNSTTPQIILAAGKTNTGNITVNGKTSGSTVFTTADATAKVITSTTAAQTSANATVTIPDLGGVNGNYVIDNRTVTLALGTSTATTATSNDTSTKVATTAYVTPASSAIGSSAIDWSLSRSFTKTLSSSTSYTITFSNTVDGEAINVRLTGASGATVTWPTVSWAAATAPTQSTSNDDVYTFIKIGSTIYGSVIQNMH